MKLNGSKITSKDLELLEKLLKNIDLEEKLFKVTENLIKDKISNSSNDKC